MKTNFIFRSKKRNEFSIENVFQSLYPYFKEYGVDVIETFLPNPRYNTVSALHENYRFAKKIMDAEVYHVTGEMHYITLALPKKKTILTIHDLVTYENSQGLKKLLWKYLWIYLPIKHAKITTCISEKTKNDIVKIFPKFKNVLKVVPDPYGDYLSKSPKIFNNEKPIILVVGTRSNKNLDRIIEAVADIKCELCIIGKLTDCQRTLLNQYQIEYKNYFNISNEEMYLRYTECDLLCFPSLYEGFGMPIIEAQVVGRAVVTSKIEPMYSVSGEGAFFVDPLSVEEIRNGIETVIQNAELRSDLISKGSLNAKKYSPAEIALEYEKIYLEILR